MANIDNLLLKTILANLAGGMIFYHIDKLIFKKKPQDTYHAACSASQSILANLDK